MRRKNRGININMVLDFISKELLTKRSHVGYRIMHQRLCANILHYTEHENETKKQ